MEAARAAIQKHISLSGKHRTEVDEIINPAVTSETIKPHRHEETTTAIDREVHQHHYHTTVQPIQHQETLPEKHVHNIIPIEHREIRHENDADTKQRVSAELGRFRDTSTIHETRHTSAQAPQVSGEHVHHHVHETVQPVIHKETIQPEVVHTTIPVHETHHVESKHHGLSALPMKTLDEFKRAGGVLTGTQSHSHEEYEGHPRPYNDKLSTTFEKLGLGHHSGTTGTTGTTGGLTSSNRNTHRTTDSGIGGIGSTDHSRISTSSDGLARNTAGPHSSDMANRADPRVDSDRDGSTRT